jgi:hypothetical protein
MRVGHGTENALPQRRPWGGRVVLGGLAAVFLFAAGGSTADAQNASDDDLKSCRAALDQFNAAFLEIERKEGAARADHDACLRDAAERDRQLERCTQSLTVAQGETEFARATARSREVESTEAARVAAEDRRRLAEEVAFLKTRVQSCGESPPPPNRDGLVASLTVEVETRGAALDKALQAVTAAMDHLATLTVPPPKATPDQPALAEVAALRDQLARAESDRAEWEDVATKLYLKNGNLEAELTGALAELARARAAAKPAEDPAPAAQCPPAAPDPAAAGQLTECRSALDDARKQIVPMEQARAAPLPPTGVDCTVAGRDLGLLGIPSGTYRLANIGLGLLVAGAQAEPVTLRQPVCLMTRALTVADVKAFIAAQPPAVKTRLKLSDVQRAVSQTFSETDPAEGLSRSVAEAYAQWLSQQTGRRFALPDRDDWLAALASWWVDRESDAAARTGVGDLLSGRYSWTATACDEKSGAGSSLLTGRADGAPPNGGIVTVCRDPDTPPRRTTVRLKLLP